MRKSTFLICLGMIFLLQCLYLNSAHAFLLFDPSPSIDTDRKTYYPNEIIHISTSWNIYIEIEENTIIQIVLTEKYPYNMSIEQILMDAIEIIECPINSGSIFFETSVDSNIFFQSISDVPCTIWIVLLFYNRVGDEIDELNSKRYIDSIILDKYDLFFHVTFPDMFLIEFNETLVYNNTIGAVQNNSIYYPNSSFYAYLFSENQLQQILSINVNEQGEFSINFSDFDINRSGEYSLCFIFPSNNLFLNYTKNCSLTVQNKALHFYMINSNVQYIKNTSNILELSFLLLDQYNKAFLIQEVCWNIHSTLEYIEMIPIEDQYHFCFFYPSEIGNYEVEISGLCQNYNLTTFLTTLNILKNNINLSLIFDTYKKNDSIHLFLLEQSYQQSNLTYLPFLHLQIYYNSSWIDVKFLYESVSEQNISIQISWNDLYPLIRTTVLFFRPQILENPYFNLIDYSHLEINLPLFAEFDCTSWNLIQNNNLSFFFTGIADDITTFFWDFGDGMTSNEKNPIHRYVLFGDFVISLVITNSNDDRDNITKIITIIPDSFPTAIFTISSMQTLINQSLYFFFIGEHGNGNLSFLWNFGDSYFSNLVNPIHQYYDPGTYYVSLQIMDVDGDIHYWQFPEPIFVDIDQFPVARFSVNTTQFIVNQAVKCVFNGDFGNNPVEFLWDFGDNEYSYDWNPTHIYYQIGVFNITLILKDANNDTDSWSNPDLIVVHSDLTPLANFTINATEINIGQSIQCNFTGRYGNQPSLFRWDFGDNYTSEEEHPIHTYNEEGFYLIILEIMDQNGDISIMSIEIRVQEKTANQYKTLLLLGGIPVGVLGVVTVSYRYLRKPKTIPLARIKI